MKKRALSFLLAFCMLISLLSGVALAADPVITLTGGEIQKGSTLVVPVTIVNNPTIGAANIHIVYDETALKLDAINGYYFDQANPAAGVQMGMMSLVGNPAANAIAYAEATGISTDGGLFWLTFSVAETAVNGDYSVTLEKLPNTSALFIGTDGSHLDIAIEPATVTVKGAAAPAAKKAALSVTAGENGTITLPATEAEYGAEITATAEAAEGYEFSHLLVNGEQVDSLTFTVPEAETVTVQGVFKKTVVTPPANAIASIVTGDTTVYATTVAELVAAIDKKGESVVTLLKDVTHTATVNIPVCTLDLNGHTWTSKNASGDWVNALYFNASATDAGATNIKSVLKNGTVHGKIAVSCNVGALRVSNVTLCSYDGTAIQLTSTSHDKSLVKGLSNADNVIENSALYSANYTGVIFNSSNADFSKVEFTIRNTTMVTASATSMLLSNAAVKISGTFNLGENVNFYGKGTNYVKTSDPAPTVTGEMAVKADGTHSITVAGIEVTGLTKWTTDTTQVSKVAALTVAASENGTITLPVTEAEYGASITATAEAAEGYEFSHLLVNGKQVDSLTFTVPAAETVTVQGVFEKLPTTIAKVVTGDNTVEVTTVAELVAAIDPKGTSTVTLLADITTEDVQKIPTCVLDLNGHTWISKSGDTWTNAVYFNDDVTDDNATNLYSVVKNGTIIGKIPLSCNVGALHVDNVTLIANGGVVLQLTHGGANSFALGKWNDGNIVENSTLFSTSDRGISFNNSGVDFSAAKVLIRKSTLATAGASFLLACTPNKNASGKFCTPGTYELGNEVAMYWAEGGNYTRIEEPIPHVTGKTVTVQDGTFSLTVQGTTYEGLYKATTPEAGAVVKVAALTVAASENGTITLPVTEAEYGASVTAAAEAAEGYEFSHLLVNGTQVDSLTFTVPEAETVTVQGVFKKTVVTPPANAIASIVTGDTTVYATTLADMLAAIDASGNSVITLYKDVTNSASINVPYSCTLDLNGHKISTTASNAWDVKAVGSENKVITIKNGTIDGAMAAACWRNGALVVDNCTLIGRGSAAIQILNHKNADANAAAYNEQNIIKNSTLYSSIWITVSFNSTNNDFTDVSLKFENCDLIAAKTNAVLSNQGKETKPGTYVLGENVNMYTLGNEYAKTSAPAPTVTGKTVYKANGTFDVTVDGTTLTGLNKFTTDEAAAPKKAALSVTAGENGTITLPATEAEYGAEITATAAPAEGYEFSHLLVNGTQVDSLTFTVPEAEAVTVQGVFKKLPAKKAALSVNAGENGTITLPAAEAEYGAEITATAEAAEGYKFSHLLVNGVKVEGLTFTVPEAATVTVQGVFEKIPVVAIPTITMGSATVGAGETVTLPITLEGNPGLAGIGFKLQYADGLTVTKIQHGDAVPTLDFTKPGKLDANPLMITFDGMDADETNGTLVEITFQVSAEAMPGDALTVDLVEIQGSIYDDNMDDVEYKLVDGVINIKKREVSDLITFEDGKLTYNGTEQTYETAVMTDATLTGAFTYTYEGDRKNAGTFTVTATYDDARATGSKTVTVTIEPATLYISSVMSWPKAYDGTTAADVGVALNGFVAGEELDYEVTANFEDKNVGMNKTVSFTVTLKGNNGNYVLAESAASAKVGCDILPREVTPALVAENTVYNGSAQKIGSVTFEGAVEGETLVEGTDYVVSYENHMNAGTAKFVVEPKANSNYTFERAVKTFEIAKAAAPALTAEGKTEYRFYDSGLKTVAILGLPDDAGAATFKMGTVMGADGAAEEISVSKDGVVSFTLIGQEEFAEYTITIPVTLDMENYEEATLELTIKISGVRGDINGDGAVTNKDVTMLRRYISGGYDLVGLIVSATDVNGDGTVTNKDVTLLRRYISGGYDVELN